jgi:hypothetical protein
VAFTQKQLRLDIEAVEKKYRQLGYVGVRVTSDFSVQKSIDRNAKNVRLNIHINERKRVNVVFEGNTSTSSSSLRDELTLLSRGLRVLRLHAITASCRRRVIWTISCGPCSTRNKWEWLSPIQLPRERGNRNVLPSCKRRVELRSRPKPVPLAMWIWRGSRAELIVRSELCATCCRTV